jgi:hypothetical protein
LALSWISTQSDAILVRGALGSQLDQGVGY